jgi:hypothetical protein
MRPSEDAVCYLTQLSGTTTVFASMSPQRCLLSERLMMMAAGRHPNINRVQFIEYRRITVEIGH